MAEDDKKALLIAALQPPKGMSKGSDAGPDDDDDVEKTAASDILDAVKERDADALQEALHRFVSSCMSSYDKDGEEEGSESEH